MEGLKERNFRLKNDVKELTERLSYVTMALDQYAEKLNGLLEIQKSTKKGKEPLLEESSNDIS
jgi:DNA/RNA endonuclease YhcR with UshA esterase domain